MLRGLCQLHELREFIMYHLAKARILLGPLLHGIAVPRHEFPAQIRIHNLQTQCQATISLDHPALLVALQGFQLILLLCILREHVQIHRMAKLHIGHLTSEYTSGYALILARILGTSSSRASVITLANHLKSHTKKLISFSSVDLIFKISN